MDLAEARRCFPVAERYVYFNHAAVSPLATPTRWAMEAFLEDSNQNGALNWQRWVGALEAVRASMAGLVGAAASEIALTKNTSEGLSAVAQGLEWRPGDRVIGFECEFPANLYPWLALRSRGVTVELLPEAALADLDRLRRACRGARLLALSYVQYLSGFRADFEAIGAICRETGTLLVVDAIQGLGAFPVAVKRCGIHALAADGHKWLTGPEGAGFLFLDESVLDQITPREVGWLSVADWEDYGAAPRAAALPTPPAWRGGAARFECGSLNTVGLIGLGAAVELLQAVGIETIAAHLLGLGDQLAAGLRRKGCRLLRPSEDPRHRSGITSFQTPAAPAGEVVARLEAAGILCAARQGWVRCAPHLYNTPAEVERLLAALP